MSRSAHPADLVRCVMVAVASAWAWVAVAVAVAAVSCSAAAGANVPRVAVRYQISHRKAMRRAKLHD